KVQEILTDDFALIAHAQNESAEPETRIVPHDVEQNRVRPDLHHRLWPKFSHFLKSSAEASAQNKNGNLLNPHVAPPSGYARADVASLPGLTSWRPGPLPLYRNIR